MWLESLDEVKIIHQLWMVTRLVMERRAQNSTKRKEIKCFRREKVIPKLVLQEREVFWMVNRHITYPQTHPQSFEYPHFFCHSMVNANITYTDYASIIKPGNSMSMRMSNDWIANWRHVSDKQYIKFSEISCM